MSSKKPIGTTTENVEYGECEPSGVRAHDESIVEIVQAFLTEEKTGRNLSIKVKGPSGEDTLCVEISAPNQPK